MSEFNGPRVGVCTSRAAVGETSPSFSKGQVAWAGLWVRGLTLLEIEGRCGWRVSQSVGVDLRNRPEC